MSTHLGPEQAIGQRLIIPLPTDEPTREHATQAAETDWWRHIADHHVVVTTPPVTTTEECPSDLAASIDSKLYQPYGYEPPMVLVIRVEGRGRIIMPNPAPHDTTQRVTPQ